MRYLSTISMLILAVLVMAYHLPHLYGRVAVDWVEKTHLFYSPVLKDFIYTEPTAGHDPQAAAKAEDHHADVAYKDSQGNYYHRLEFERNLPFIYVRNMDKRGFLPMNIEGKEFNRDTIDTHRQVLELSVRNLPGHTPPQNFWPILDVNPEQAGLVFPVDRFRMTPTTMEFINADYNRVDQELTNTWTQALTDQEFKFPARQVSGSFTILKPFDNGIFVVDHNYQVFHLQREEGRATVVKTPIDPAFKCRHITMVESNQRQFHGLLLDGQNQLHLITTDNYGLVKLQLPDYDPETMDFKIIFDPLHQTAVYSDHQTIRAVTMDRGYQPLANHAHSMSRSVRTWPEVVGEALFPFEITMASENSRMMKPALEFSPTFFSASLLVGLICSFLYGAWVLYRGRRPNPASLLFVLTTGIYGLIAGIIILDE